MSFFISIERKNELKELIIKAVNGDTEAFKELIECVKDTLYRISKAILTNDEDVYDAINSTIYRTYKGLKKLKSIEYFKTWITRIVINESIRIYKKNKKHNILIEKLQKINNNQYQENFTDDLENNIDFEIIMNQLNEEEKIVFVLYFKEKYNTTEIACILNENVNTVRSRLRRGKEKIYNFLKGDVEYEK